MAGIKKKYKASTLVELIIALLIISTISVMASLFLVKTYKKTNISYKIRAFLILDNEIEISSAENDYSNLNKTIDNFKFERISSNYGLNNKLRKVDFVLRDSKDSVILERQKIIIVENEENP